MRNYKKFIIVALFFGLILSCSRQDEQIFNNADQDQTAQTDLRWKSSAIDGSDIFGVIKDRYIVVFKSHVNDPKTEAKNLKTQFGLSTGHIYENAIKGFSAYIPGNAIQGLQNNPNIDYIEPDLSMSAFDQTIPTGIRRIQADLNPTADIDGVRGDVDVDVAILDSGVDIDHPDLNVAGGVRYYTISTGPPSSRGSHEDDNYDDDNGHGTHVSGTVAALDNDIGVVGVAPGARIWGVKILNAQGSGYLSDIIAGLDWVAARTDIEVINMSIGGQGLSSSYQEAIQRCVDAGVVVVVAAGNESMDVYGPDGTFGTNDDIIPAAYPEVAAISALADSDGAPGGLGGPTSYDPDDSFASGFSNFSNSVVANNPVNSTGMAIDLMLPGVDILSTYIGGYATGSGTSMASPHGAGLAALYIADNGRATDANGVYAIRQALIDAGVGQQSPYGLVNFNDPDDNEENIGWAVPVDGNLPPVANAGPDQTITDSDENGEIVTLDGSGSTDDTEIISYVWTEGEITLGEGVSISLDFAIGIHTVTLEVTDNDGATDTDVVVITINGPAVNQPPVASFSYATDGLVVTFTDESTDSDGSVISWSWDFGDNNGTSTAQNPIYTYAVAGTYEVTLSVTDNNTEVSDMFSQSITVTDNSGGSIILTATGYKTRGVRYVDLEWSGAVGDNVDVKINGSIDSNVTNNGATTINLGRNSGTFVFQVCETDGSTCSNEATVIF